MKLKPTQSLTLSEAFDLAGYCQAMPDYWQTRSRLNYLVERYLSLDILSDRLLDFPTQFVQPHPRHWQPIHWRNIHRQQIIGVEPRLFLGVILSAAEIEAPIRDYSGESRRYLQQVCPQLARFIAGTSSGNGRIVELGIWEKEERQHAPAFRKIYQQLTGEKVELKPNTIVPSQFSSFQDAPYRHLLSRITTEWSATSTYLWLMAHSTGELQSAIGQPLQDEVNHLAKFWGITRWLFADSPLQRCRGLGSRFLELLQHHASDRSSSSEVLHLNSWQYGIEIAFIFTRVLVQMCRWDAHLSSEVLNHLFGSPTGMKAIA